MAREAVALVEHLVAHWVRLRDLGPKIENEFGLKPCALHARIVRMRNCTKTVGNPTLLWWIRPSPKSKGAPMSISSILRRSVLLGVVLPLLLAACGAEPPPIDIAASSAVQSQIKQQLVTYMRAAEKRPVRVKLNGQEGPETDLRTLSPEQRRPYFWCGDGSIDYDIKGFPSGRQVFCQLELF